MNTDHPAQIYALPAFRPLCVMLLLCGVLLLQGCPALVAGGAAGAMIVGHDPRPTSVLLSDQRIANRATDKVYSDPELKGKIHINVEAYNGVVLVTGEVLSQSAKTRAIDLIKQVDGIKKIYNELAVADLTSFTARNRDAWITSHIKNQLAASDTIRSSQVLVVTERGVVFLMGTVTEAQGQEAAEIARHVENVVKVVKLFEYKAV